MVFIWYLFEAYKGYFVASLLQIGIGNALATDPDSDRLERLNRKMIAALSRGAALDA